MSLYYFILKTPHEHIPDRDGIELSDEIAAREEATIIARELMRHREISTRPWRLEVRDEDLHPVFELLFAEVDETTSYLPKEFRDSIERVSRSTALLADTVLDVRNTLADVTETLMQANHVIGSVAVNRR